MAAPPRRAAWLVVLALGVTLLHLWGVEELGRALSLSNPDEPSAQIRRIEVAFVRELQQAAPRPAPVVLKPATQRRARVAAPAPKASAPPVSAPVVVAAAPVPTAAPPASAAASAPDGPIGEPFAAAASAPNDGTASMPAFAAQGAGFEWPPSTRLSYTLNGYYRGPVEGHARVEWLRDGERYQVHLDVAVGPPFAPLASRRSSSEGLLGEQGLRPQRYEEVTRAALAAPRTLRLALEATRIVLADGREVPRMPGAQDTASQFVQLTWLFSTQPSRLHVGSTIEIPLALPRRVGIWVYDVVAEQVLETGAGRVLTYHVKPRPESRRPGELLVQTWIAPTLQYLPVRIRIEQDEQTWADLMIDRAPQQEAAPPTVTSR